VDDPALVGKAGGEVVGDGGEDAVLGLNGGVPGAVDEFPEADQPLVAVGLAPHGSGQLPDRQNLSVGEHPVEGTPHGEAPFQVAPEEQLHPWCRGVEGVPEVRRASGERVFRSSIASVVTRSGSVSMEKASLKRPACAGGVGLIASGVSPRSRAVETAVRNPSKVPS